MKTTMLAVTLGLFCGVTQAALLPGDAAKGKALHDQQCVACHDNKVYIRADRRVKTVEGLMGQVNGCVRQTGAKLDSKQIDDVIKYLNESFYKFN